MSLDQFVTKALADYRAHLLKSGLSEGTVRSRLYGAVQFARMIQGKEVGPDRIS